MLKLETVLPANLTFSICNEETKPYLVTTVLQIIYLNMLETQNLKLIYKEDNIFILL